MTPFEDVYATLSATGIPGTRLAWPTGKAPDLPWWVYRMEQTNTFCADNENYSATPRFRVELYEAAPDPEVEGKIADAISQIGPYERYDDWSPDEKCLITAYEFTYAKEEA